jgi:hypothetical protein
MELHSQHQFAIKIGSNQYQKIVLKRHNLGHSNSFTHTEQDCFRLACLDKTQSKKWMGICFCVMPHATQTKIHTFFEFQVVTLNYYFFASILPDEGKITLIAMLNEPHRRIRKSNFRT